MIKKNIFVWMNQTWKKELWLEETQTGTCGKPTMHIALNTPVL